MGSRRRAFTLIEVAAASGMLALLAGVLLPSASRARQDMRGSISASNLATIGQGSAMYAVDHGGRLFTYTWRAGLHQLPDGTTKMASSDADAASWQNTEILMRQTGRVNGPHRINNFQGRLPHRRYTHLVLMDYLNLPFPSVLFADPSDANLLQWQANPLDLSVNNNIPYGQGSGQPQKGYDNPAGWTKSGIMQRWPFGSSYQRTVSAWAPDGLHGEPTVAPVAATPHLTSVDSGTPLADGRNYAEIAFPSAKVHMFEEFDREQAGSPYFAYDHARPEKLMFDGSINDRPSGEAGPSWNPHQGKREWLQTYVPIHTFPIPLDGLGDPTLLSQRYRWTLGGLKGRDYVATFAPGRR